MKRLLITLTVMLLSVVGMAQQKVSVTDFSSLGEKDVTLLVINKKDHFLLNTTALQEELGTLAIGIEKIEVWEENRKDFALYLKQVDTKKKAVKSIVLIDMKKGAAIPEKFKK